MAVRTQTEIDALILKAKQNCFAREQTYGGLLQVGVAQVPNMRKQIALITAASSDYATLAQKNIYIDMLVSDNLTIASNSNLFASNLVAAGL